MDGTSANSQHISIVTVNVQGMIMGVFMATESGKVRVHVTIQSEFSCRTVLDRLFVFGPFQVQEIFSLPVHVMLLENGYVS